MSSSPHGGHRSHRRPPPAPLDANNAWCQRHVIIRFRPYGRCRQLLLVGAYLVFPDPRQFPDQLHSVLLPQVSYWRRQAASTWATTGLLTLRPPTRSPSVILAFVITLDLSPGKQTPREQKRALGPERPPSKVASAEGNEIDGPEDAVALTQISVETGDT